MNNDIILIVKDLILFLYTIYDNFNNSLNNLKFCQNIIKCTLDPCNRNPSLLNYNLFLFRFEKTLVFHKFLICH